MQDQRTLLLEHAVYHQQQLLRAQQNQRWWLDVRRVERNLKPVVRRVERMMR